MFAFLCFFLVCFGMDWWQHKGTSGNMKSFCFMLCFCKTFKTLVFFFYLKWKGIDLNKTSESNLLNQWQWSSARCKGLWLCDAREIQFCKPKLIAALFIEHCSSCKHFPVFLFCFKISYLSMRRDLGYVHDKLNNWGLNINPEKIYFQNLQFAYIHNLSDRSLTS